PGRRNPHRLTLSPPPRPVAQPTGVLAQPPQPLVSVLRPVHWPHLSGPPHRRGPERLALRVGARIPRAPTRREGLPALAGRPGVPQPADGCDRQHPPGGILHRQDVFPGWAHRPSRPPGAAGIRDATARADESHPAVAVAVIDSPLLAQSL